VHEVCVHDVWWRNLANEVGYMQRLERTVLARHILHAWQYDIYLALKLAVATKASSVARSLKLRHVDLG